MFVEETLEAGKPVCNTLCVIEPVYGKNNLLVAEVLFDLALSFRDFRVLRRIMEFIIIDTEGKHFRFYSFILHHDGAELTVVSVNHLNSLEEMLHVFMRVEPDQIGTEHAADDLFLPWSVQQTKDLE